MSERLIKEYRMNLAGVKGHPIFSCGVCVGGGCKYWETSMCWSCCRHLTKDERAQDMYTAKEGMK